MKHTWQKDLGINPFRLQDVVHRTGVNKRQLIFMVLVAKEKALTLHEIAAILVNLNVAKDAETLYKSLRRARANSAPFYAQGERYLLDTSHPEAQKLRAKCFPDMRSRAKRRAALTPQKTEPILFAQLEEVLINRPLGFSSLHSVMATLDANGAHSPNTALPMAEVLRKMKHERPTFASQAMQGEMRRRDRAVSTLQNEGEPDRWYLNEETHLYSIEQMRTKVRKGWAKAQRRKEISATAGFFDLTHAPAETDRYCILDEDTTTLLPYALAIEADADLEEWEFCVKLGDDGPLETVVLQEAYCPRIFCDCRRVMLRAIDVKSGVEVASHIYKFDKIEYESQLDADDLRDETHFTFPLTLALGDALENNPHLRARFIRHYEQMKKAITQPDHPSAELFSEYQGHPVLPQFRRRPKVVSLKSV